MANLTVEMQKMIKDQFPFLATTDENGFPKVGPKGSLHVLDETHLVYYEHTFRHAYHNLQHNQHAAVAVVDREAQKGFRFEGTAHIHEADVLADKILSATKIFERFPRAAVIIIDVERIYKLDNNLDAGTRLA